jgi:hypothetical protein
MPTLQRSTWPTVAGNCSDDAVAQHGSRLNTSCPVSATAGTAAAHRTMKLATLPPNKCLRVSGVKIVHNTSVAR